MLLQPRIRLVHELGERIRGVRIRANIRPRIFTQHRDLAVVVKVDKFVGAKIPRARFKKLGVFVDQFERKLARLWITNVERAKYRRAIIRPQLPFGMRFKHVVEVPRHIE